MMPVSSSSLSSPSRLQGPVDLLPLHFVAARLAGVCAVDHGRRALRKHEAQEWIFPVPGPQSESHGGSGVVLLIVVRRPRRPQAIDGVEDALVVRGVEFAREERFSEIEDGQEVHRHDRGLRPQWFGLGIRHLFWTLPALCDAFSCRSGRTARGESCCSRACGRSGCSS